tara:strand:- start:1369 stop:1635 length:267 start_codon:yes stop_codon:yes gene_type:complete
MKKPRILTDKQYEELKERLETDYKYLIEILKHNDHFIVDQIQDCFQMFNDKAYALIIENWEHCCGIFAIAEGTHKEQAIEIIIERGLY